MTHVRSKRDTITASLNASGKDFTSWDVARIIMALANIPHAFKSSDLTPFVRSRGEEVTYHVSQEALNRLFQRWRKLGLMSFGKGNWTLARNAWDEMQLAAARFPGLTDPAMRKP